MATPAPTPATPALVEAAWKEFAWSPLVPVAVTVSVGLVVDRYLEVPLAGELVVSALGILAWVASRWKKSDVAALWLWIAAGGLAAAHHHINRQEFAPNDIGTILFTGDLEGAGQDEVFKRPITPVDVMLAPHHGAVGANARKEPDGKFSPGLMASWAKPRLVISCQEPRATTHLVAAYAPGGATVWDTASAGAVIVRSHATGLVAETFRTGEVRVVRKGR